MDSPPPAAHPGAVTALLRQAVAGDAGAFDRAFALVYAELRQLAAWMARGRAGGTLSSTALVHEVYLKLAPVQAVAREASDDARHDEGAASDGAVRVRDRAHFLALAARAMRQVLVDAARERQAAKRGGGDLVVTLDEAAAVAPMRAERLLVLDEALARLAALDARQARVVELRFFAGLDVEETASVLGISAPTVKRDWRAARAWLAAQLDDDG